jgi:hypothetical protein
MSQWRSSRQPLGGHPPLQSPMFRMYRSSGFHNPALIPFKKEIMQDINGYISNFNKPA